MTCESINLFPSTLGSRNDRFLIAALHMDSVAEEDNIGELEESLQRLPGELDRTFNDASKRIKGQESRKRARAEQVIALISCESGLILVEMQSFVHP